MERTNFDSKDIIRAGRAIKVLKVAGAPGMDEIAIKLHTHSLTFAERNEAETWADIFHIVASEPDLTPIEIAAKIVQKRGR